MQARPPLYVHFHKRILEVAETVLPIEKVCSIDEMRFRLIGQERQPDEARALALRMKAALRDGVGERMKCSIGIAPNAFLAKLATDLEKPDGLVVIEGRQLPDRLRGLALTEFCGINKRMKVRLESAGIFSSDDLVDASPAELTRAFGSIVGQRWWYWLRGHDLPAPEHERKSLGHSHVLPPDLRTDEGARDVLLRLAVKATARLRANDLWARAMTVYVAGHRRDWQAHGRLAPTQDTITVTQRLLELWEGRDFDVPKTVGITFTDLARPEEVTPSLFDPTMGRSLLNRAVDAVNQKFGKNKVYLAGIHAAREAAAEKIAFDKTWLFSEGKGDNEWIDEE